MGEILAERTGRSFIDLDQCLVERFSRPIADVFATVDEAVFRTAEQNILQEVLDESTSDYVVIATGGGTLLGHVGQRLITDNTICPNKCHI